MDLLGYEEGYCEVCEKVVEERELQQCQLGFCRTFLCTSCAQHCSSCKNGNDADSLFMALCSPCSNKVAPKCFNCKNRLCGRCTSFTKCKRCSNLVCSECLLRVEFRFLQESGCRSCAEKQKVRSLETICKNTIRKYIGSNLPGIGPDRKRKLSPSDRIDAVIDQLILPSSLANLIKLSPPT